MIRYALVAMLGACGSAPAPAPKVAPKPAPPQVAPVSCRDASVILRGPLDDNEAGRHVEETIERVCRDYKWPADVLECLGSQADTGACLDKLPGDRKLIYENELGITEDDGSGGAPDAPMDDVACDDVVDEPWLFPPALDDQAPERDWTVDARRRVLHEACDHDWNIVMRNCLADSDSPAQIEACLAKLDTAERTELVTGLTRVSEIAKKIAAARKKPGSVVCKQVVTVHYGDPTWKGKLDSYKAAERKRLIAASRTLMTKACTEEGWPETLRACVVVGGGQPCFEAARMALRWGYPAAGTVKSIGVRECDEYGEALAAIATCDKISDEARAALGKSFDELRAHMAGISGDDRKKAAVSCAAGRDAVRAVAQSAGC
jgi:hypothetical protein